MYNSIGLEIKGLIRIEYTCSKGINYLDRIEVAGSSPVGILDETLASQGFFTFYM
ncbi:hypothetical protein [Bacillus atrophaeus]|uniref:hypothetical protein n=1 Tax=Bacillus atrophaeus TaxID=1452 RepID=UPI00227DDDD3|nr:hypothetical protein [Bacillus atrophaeus]MCY9203617.1 hypothetical protein [Bacillus atrophaeus]MEC0885690.1 hypothetical protein [Bacillus atrophaeus]